MAVYALKHTAGPVLCFPVGTGDIVVVNVLSI